MDKRVPISALGMTHTLKPQPQLRSSPLAVPSLRHRDRATSYGTPQLRWPLHGRTRPVSIPAQGRHPGPLRSLTARGADRSRGVRVDVQPRRHASGRRATRSSDIGSIKASASTCRTVIARSSADPCVHTRWPTALVRWSLSQVNWGKSVPQLLSHDNCPSSTDVRQGVRRLICETQRADRGRSGYSATTWRIQGSMGPWPSA